MPEPKAAKGRRSITLPAMAVEALRQHRQRQVEEKALAGEEWQERGQVFTNQLGKPLERGNVVNRSFNKLLQKASIGHIDFHDLRHSSVTVLLSRGVHPKIV